MQRNIYEKHTELFILHANTNENYIYTYNIWKYTYYIQPTTDGHLPQLFSSLWNLQVAHRPPPQHHIIYIELNTLSKTHFQAYNLAEKYFSVL